MDEASWGVVVRRVNQHLGSRYSLVRPLSGGRQGGAWVVTDVTEPGSVDERCWSGRVIRGLTERREETALLVRAPALPVDHPTPRWRAWGGFEDGSSYVMTDLAEGTTAAWTSLHAATLIDAVERQAGLAHSGQPSWTKYMRQTLASTVGPRSDIAALGPDGARFLHLIDEAAGAANNLLLPETDAVHGDLEAGNILIADPEDPDSPIVIIDIDACGAGTRAIDYAWLLRDVTTHQAPASTLSLLSAAGVAVAGPNVWAACVAFACLELVGFVARSGNQIQALSEIHLLTPLLRDVSDR